MRARIVVSLADVIDAALPNCLALAAALDRRAVPLSLLVRTRRTTEPGILLGTPSWQWINTRLAGGHAAVVLEGVEPPITGRHAEFAGLRRHEARLRMIAATRELAALRVTSTCFCPPRWQSSTGTRLALRELGFAVCTDSLGVHRLTTSEFVRGRTLTPGRGPAGWGRAVIGAAGRTARRGGLVQLALRAADLAEQRVVDIALDAVDNAVDNGAVALTYPALATSRLATSRLAATAPSSLLGA